MFFAFSKTILKRVCLVHVFENCFLLSKTRKACFVPSFFVLKNVEHTENTKLKNKTSFERTPKRCFLCFQKLFSIFKNKENKENMENILGFFF